MKSQIQMLCFTYQHSSLL